METLFAYYNKIVYEYADPRTADYFMTGSPLPVTLVLIGYWLFIKKIGPALMKDRPPYDVKLIMQIYNLMQIGINAYLFGRILYLFIAYEVLVEDNRVLCINHNTNSENHMACVSIAWLYYLVKIIDLLDTVFFVLRKKFNQVTTLHTYHHIIMAYGLYLSTHYHPAGAAGIMAMINSLVHAVMYFYYFYSACDTNACNSIWWKRYITQLQLAQFCFMLVWFTPQLFVTDCGYPKWIVFLIVSQAVVMLNMFGNFYYKAFIKSKNN